MEKIILVYREPGNHEHMIALIEAMFPECTVEIIPGTVGKVNPVNAPIENVHSCDGGELATRRG